MEKKLFAPNSSAAWIPSTFASTQKKLKTELTLFASGLVLMALLAKIMIPLPFTPVPITGQSFGIFLIALLWGSKRALAICGTYLALGFSGLPVFAAVTGAHTLGYLAGMLAAAYVIGLLSDKGWAQSFKKAFLASFLGATLIYIFGLSVLSFYIPQTESLLSLGLYPFIPGALVKMALAAGISQQVNKKKVS